MSVIRLEGIRVRANHGCLDEEALIGGDYIVDVIISQDVSKSYMSDELNDTVDYVQVFDIVRKEMKIRSKLIEHVAFRILKGMKSAFPTATFEIIVTKINPPMNGPVDKVSFTIKG